MNRTGKNKPRARRAATCNCPASAPAWPLCCSPHLQGVIDLNQESNAHMPTVDVREDSSSTGIDTVSLDSSVAGLQSERTTPPSGVGGMQPQGGGEGLGGPKRSFSLTGKEVRQILTGEFKLTKRLQREMAEVMLATEGTTKAARKLLELLDSDKEMVALAAAKDILDRVGVGKTKETLGSLLKDKIPEDEVPPEWLERIVDSENSNGDGNA